MREGPDLSRKGKCGSKRRHMFQSAGIWPPVQTGTLYKRLLIRESAKTSGVEAEAAPPYCHPARLYAR